MSRYGLPPVVAALAAAALLAAGCSNGGPARDTGPARVGVVLTTTGSGAAIGVSQRTSIRLAGARGLRLSVRDDGGVVSRGAAAVADLVDDGVDVIIGPTLSNVAREAYTGADIGEVPMIGIAQTVPALTAFRPYLWRVSMPADLVIPPAVHEAVRQTKARSAFVLASRDDVLNRAEAEVFADSFDDVGVTVVGTAAYVTGQTDFTAIVAAVQAARPDLLGVAALPVDAVRALRELRAAGVRAPVVGGNSFNSSAVVEAAGPAAEELYVGSAWSIDSVDPVSRRFVADWRRRFASDPDQFAAQA